MKHFITKLYVVGLLLALPLAVFAQGKVTGKLVDSNSNEPLIGAAIYLKSNKGVGTVTSLDGTFELSLENGKKELIFTYLGYIDQVKEVNVTGDVNLGDIALESSSVGINEIAVIASVAVDRKTPVAMSNIKPEIITEKLGTQEFPELLKSTPSVYATKGGGGFGDSRITIRGFDSNNVGVLINGVPVNDMESGKVYWSNWAGLTEVTHSIQVQRGLGASRLALSSVGGTKNIITKSTDVTKGGAIYAGIGNDGRIKRTFTASTGLLENNWAVTVSGAQQKGDGYIRGTDFNGYSYFLNVSKIINDDHRLSFTAFGAPQWHNQRGTKHLIEDYRSHKDGAKYNSDFGYREGKVYGGAYGYNEYHKPQMSLNHYWNINESSMLSTSIYASISQGGGRRADGENSNWLKFDRDTGRPTEETKLTGDGFLDYDAVIAENTASTTGSKAIMGNSVNQHQWYGILSTFTKDINNVKITGGFDGRYYIGEHYKEVTDLMGGKYFLDSEDINRPEGTPLTIGDKYAYHNDGVVTWAGLFGQAEYTINQFSTFITATISSKNYQRIDYMQYTPDNKNSEWVNFLPWSVKAGVNYNINDNHNVYLNGGYFTRAADFTNSFVGYTNELIEDPKEETVISGDIGYGYRTSQFSAKLGGYYTNWKDKGLKKSFGEETAIIPGINALHVGIEFEAEYKPSKDLSIRGMFSYGDWIWQDDVSFELYDDNQNSLGTFDAFIEGVHVGNSAQMTAALGVNYKVLPDLKLGVDVNYYGKNYAEFDPSTRTDENFRGDSWQLPDATLCDINATYSFKIGSLDALLIGNVSNLFNTVYITDADDKATHDATSALVYYGFGTTWSTGLRINF